MNKAGLHLISLCLLATLAWWLWSKEGQSRDLASSDVLQSAQSQDAILPAIKTQSSEPLLLEPSSAGDTDEQISDEPLEKVASSRFIRHINIEPDQLYRNNIHQAEQGNAKAQLYVSEAMEPCQSLAYKTSEAIDELEARAQTAASVIDTLRRQLKSCQALFQTLGNDNVDSLRRYWLNESAKNGQALARLMSLFDGKATPKQELVRPLLLEALNDLNNNPRFSEKTFAMVLNYYYAFIEAPLEPSARQAGHVKQSLEADTWSYIYCYHNRHCELDRYLHLMGNYYHEHEIIAMEELAQDYLSAIKDNHWDLLNL